jgi:RND family efflux transporter MFP subunit
LKQALNAIEYATLTAPTAGVIVAVSGERGQVVSAGQTLALLAEQGAREIVVAVPEDRRASLPTTALAQPLGSTELLPVTMREVAAAADPLTRTWLARYQMTHCALPGANCLAAQLPLGTTVTLQFAAPALNPPRVRVPLGAVLEQADGAAVWRVVAGQVQREPVTVLAIDGECAEIQTTLAPGTPVVALGVNRLVPGQTVRVRTP